MCYGVPKKPLSGTDLKRVQKRERKMLSAEELAKRVIMNISTDLPSDWNDFADERFDRVMFYKKIAPKEYECHCECGKTTIMNKVRSGTKVVCPNCNWTVLLKDATRKKDGLPRYDQRLCFAYLQRYKDDITARLFVGYKSSVYGNGNYVEKNLRFVEEHRQYLCSKGFYYGFRPVWDGTYESWREGCGRSHGSFWTMWCVDYEPMNTYDKNLSEVLDGTSFKYSMLDKATTYNLVQPLKYLCDYRRNPKVEMLYKMGLYGVALQFFENTTVSYELSKIKSPKELGLETKEDFEYCRYFGYYDIKAFKEVKKWQYFENYKALAVKFIRILNHRSGADFNYSFISREGMFNYFLTQRDFYKKKDIDENIKNFLNDYCDYISSAKHLKINLKDTMNYKPKDLPKSHDWAIASEKAKETKIYDSQIKAIWKKYRKLVEFSDGELSVILPKNSLEIIEEGVRQDHCVGKYCERVANGESLILFVRKNSNLDESFYTMEIKPDMNVLDIVQCRGYHNDVVSNDWSKDFKMSFDKRLKENSQLVERFCERYGKWFNARDTKGFDGQVKAIYYKAVHRKNGEYISNYDRRTVFKVGETISTELDKDSDKVHVQGLHIASLSFAQKFGDSWKDVAILEVEVDIHDVVIPDAMDQVRTSKMKVLREVPMSEMGEWGKRHYREGVA